MIRAHRQTALVGLAGLAVVALYALLQPSLPEPVLSLAPLVAVLGLPQRIRSAHRRGALPGAIR